MYWRDDSPGLSWAITDARGGVSHPPYAGNNLGAHVGDDPEAVARNRALLAAELDLAPEQVSWLTQVHGNAVVTVTKPLQPSPQADAQLTRERGLGLAVLVADCTPVLLADPQAGVVAAVHAGRPGMMTGVVTNTLSAMSEAGAEQIQAVIGPSVCGRCYEVPASLRDEAAAQENVSAALSWQGTPAIDVATGVVAQLRRGGVQELTWLPGCTRENADLYSYRRDGRTGRFAAIVVLR